MPKDLNEARIQRATSDREIKLGPFVFTRVVAAAPEVLIGFHRPDSTTVDQEVLDRFDDTIIALLEPTTLDTRTDRRVESAEAWRHMRQVGDEYGVITFNDMGEIVTMLLEGVVERPTEQPSESSDGSETPPTGTGSTDDSPSPEPRLMHLTPVASATPPTPAG